MTRSRHKAEHWRVAVIGCGRLGSHLANQLSRHGHDVVSIDLVEEAFGALEFDYSGFRIVGDATQISVLRDAGLDATDVAFITTRDDNVNMMVAQIVSNILGVPRVVARVFHPSRESLYHGLGIETVCPTVLAAAECLDRITLTAVRQDAGER